MTVLVTGGAGFVGAYVVRDLIRAGHRVVVYDAAIDGNALQSVLREPAREDFVIKVQGAITDSWLLLKLCQQHEVKSVVHLASPLTQDVTANPVRGIQDICLGTAGIFEVARAFGIRRVVWASSVAVFGRTSMYPAGPLANDAAHTPLSLYGSCKSLCESMAERYRTVDGVDSVALRLTVVYGAGRLRGYMSFPSYIIRDAALGKHVSIPFGDQLINWQYVEDVSAMVLAALRAERPSAVINFNTTGDTGTYREAAEVLRKLAPTSSIDVNAGVDSSLRDIPMQFDDSELRMALGYKPRFSMEDGIRAAFDEYRRQASEDQVQPNAAQPNAAKEISA